MDLELRQTSETVFVPGEVRWKGDGVAASASTTPAAASTTRRSRGGTGRGGASTGAGASISTRARCCGATCQRGVFQLLQGAKLTAWCGMLATTSDSRVGVVWVIYKRYEEVGVERACHSGGWRTSREWREGNCVIAVVLLGLRTL